MVHAVPLAHPIARRVRRTNESGLMSVLGGKWTAGPYASSGASTLLFSRDPHVLSVEIFGRSAALATYRFERREAWSWDWTSPLRDAF